ncbi:hypothetical protein SAMN05877962_10517 [Alloalcanivorax xenomutans]|uniref:nucleotidyl transferase AbiEii/AbiGii toxin family protein n=1 Tax=Alcanivoracaceae TaxID=224372 RepID=UPI000BD280DE|nr:MULTISPECIES: nucleotidyl transferase AbiEii/AbiGii toxin family protein [Alcanivoracaceae]SOC02058.1 hypothetical protein SAMN05877962_10517 [Alloalcanivorax xenomutans]
MASKDFEALVTRAMAVPGRTHMRPVVEKELLHYDILFALDRQGLLDRLTFQGGTSLRLCHGAPRFSEDLDFVAGTEFGDPELQDIKVCLEQYLGERYGLQVWVKEPLSGDDTRPGVQVRRWQVSIRTAPERPDLPHQRIKLEVVNVPAHTRVLMPLRHNYDFLPDGYDETLVGVETLDEVFVDKLIAYPATAHPRYRDIWDLQWLAQREAKMDEAVLRAKIDDYGLEDYPGKLEQAIKELPGRIQSQAFMDTLSRFLPEDTLDRTLKRAGFLDYLTSAVGGHLQTALKALRAGSAPEPPFNM